jgi:hypothetical protein
MTGFNHLHPSVQSDNGNSHYCVDPACRRLQTHLSDIQGFHAIGTRHFEKRYPTRLIIRGYQDDNGVFSKEIRRLSVRYSLPESLDEAFSTKVQMVPLSEAMDAARYVLSD